MKKTYTIVFREILIGTYYEEAETLEEAIRQFNEHAQEGNIDFTDMVPIDGQIISIELEEETPIDYQNLLEKRIAVLTGKSEH